MLETRAKNDTKNEKHTDTQNEGVFAWDSFRLVI